MPKTLVVFYSRTGTTKKVAQNLATKLEADIEEIIAQKDRRGIWGYLLSGKEAMRKIPAKIAPTQKDASLYDLVIVGTPMWAMTVSGPVRAYLAANKIKFKKLAFFLLRGGEKDGRVFAEMENISGQKPLATLAVRTKDAVKDNFDQKVEEFINRLTHPVK